MVFVIRRIRMCDDLKDYKICLINDRTDLEEQLGETAELTGEKVTYIASSADLKEKLKGPASNLNMVMIHKFQENARRESARLSGRHVERSAGCLLRWGWSTVLNVSCC